MNVSRILVVLIADHLYALLWLKHTGGTLLKLPLLFCDFSCFFAKILDFGRHFGRPLASGGVPKLPFPGKVPKKTKKNVIQEPLLKKYEILMENQCENERAGRVKTSVSLDTSFKI